MIANYLRKTIVGLTAACGGWYLLVFQIPVVHHFLVVAREPEDYRFLFGVVPLIAIPWVLMTFFGIKLWRAVDLAPLKGVMGVFVLFGALWFSMGFSTLCSYIILGRSPSDLFLRVGGWVVQPLFVRVAGQLARQLAPGGLKTGGMVGRGVLALIALHLWSVLWAVFLAYGPMEEGSANVPAWWWSLMAPFGPILIAWVAYRTAIARWFPQPAAGPGQADGEFLSSPGL